MLKKWSKMYESQPNFKTLRTHTPDLCTLRKVQLATWRVFNDKNISLGLVSSTSRSDFYKWEVTHGQTDVVYSKLRYR